jgi:threonyl-tRNA synthetase
MAIRNNSSGLQPTERFDLTYKGSDNELHRPVMIHRAPFGSMERFIAILLEHTAGNFHFG